MRRETWTPILPSGEIDPAELRRPAETAELTTWEAVLPEAWTGEGLADVCLSWFDPTAALRRHRYVLLFPVAHPPSLILDDGVTVAVGPITTQSEADRSQDTCCCRCEARSSCRASRTPWRPPPPRRASHRGGYILRMTHCQFSGDVALVHPSGPPLVGDGAGRVTLALGGRFIGEILTQVRVRPVDAVSVRASAPSTFRFFPLLNDHLRHGVLFSRDYASPRANATLSP